MKKQKSVCSKTNDYHMCMKLMRSGTRNLDPNYKRGLTQLAIDLATSKANDIKNEQSYKDNRGIDGDSYYWTSSDKMCSYSMALKDLSQANEYFNNGRYKRVGHEVRQAKEKVEDCKNQFKNISLLRRWDREFELLCDVVTISLNE